MTGTMLPVATKNACMLWRTGRNSFWICQFADECIWARLSNRHRMDDISVTAPAECSCLARFCRRPPERVWIITTGEIVLAPGNHECAVGVLTAEYSAARGGLRLSSRDLLKIGQLYQNGGRGGRDRWERSLGAHFHPSPCAYRRNHRLWLSLVA